MLRTHTHSPRLVVERQEERESQRDQETERLKMEMEERIWREAEEGMRQEFESHMQQERQNLHQQVSLLSSLVVLVCSTELDVSKYLCVSV